MRQIKIISSQHSLAWIDTMSQLAHEFKCGNCVEQSCVAFMYLAKMGSQFPIELFNNPGRKIGDPKNPTSWNGDAAICDLLTGDYHLISDPKIEATRVLKSINSYPLIVRYTQHGEISKEDYFQDKSLNKDISETEI